MLKVDLHTHTIKSEHAINTLEETLRKAAQNKMEAIAITDHSPAIDNTIWLTTQPSDQANWKYRVKGPDLNYFRVLLSRYQSPPEIPVTLFKGIECSILSEGERITDVPLTIADQFDIVIASIHTLPSLFKVKSKEQVTENMIEAMKDPVDIIGHPCMKSCLPYFEPLTKAAADRGITLELNNNALKLKKALLEDVIAMLHYARLFNCRVSLGSDSHMNNELGIDDDVRALLRETGFPRALIVNQSLADTCEYIRERKQVRHESLKQKTGRNTATTR